MNIIHIFHIFHSYRISIRRKRAFDRKSFVSRFFFRQAWPGSKRCRVDDENVIRYQFSTTFSFFIRYQFLVFVIRFLRFSFSFFVVFLFSGCAWFERELRILQDEGKFLDEEEPSFIMLLELKIDFIDLIGKEMLFQGCGLNELGLSWDD